MQPTTQTSIPCNHKIGFQNWSLPAKYLTTLWYLALSITKVDGSGMAQQTFSMMP
jgi:hypothetical protein